MEALLIIDVQEAYVGHLRSDKHFLEAVDYMNTAADIFRSAGKPVIFVRHIVKGSEGPYRTIGELEMKEGDIEVLKRYNSSFWETDLDQILKEHGVKFLVLSGYAAEYCIAATFFGALERGYEPNLLQNGILAKTPEGLLAAQLSHASTSVMALRHFL